MNDFQYTIVRFLCEKAALGTRTTYTELGAHLGRDTGRGLGKDLGEILDYCHDNQLPLLTTIVVRKGEFVPAENSHQHFQQRFGKLDFPGWQDEVFAFDWSKVSEFAEAPVTQIMDRDIWLTSFWGFNPKGWGCLGFASEAKRNSFIRQTRPNTLVFIYVTKNNGPEEMRGKVVGALEVSHEKGHIKEFLSGDEWAAKEGEAQSKDKWQYALKVTRAWEVVPEEWVPIEDLMPNTYNKKMAQHIGSNCVSVNHKDIDAVRGLTLTEIEVYSQTGPINPDPQTIENILSPSRAIYPAKGGYFVGETDGPKHLYILRLTGDIAAYLGRPAEDLEYKMVIKVGFSKSPLTRRRQIQSAYPAGTYEWEVYRPEDIPKEAPYPNSKTAIAGEDAMKARLVKDGAESLGLEFFLAEERLVHQIWFAGKAAAEKYMGEDV